MIKQFFKMSALRQSLSLSITFLVVLAAGGFALQFFLVQEIRTVSDQELKKEIELLAQKFEKK